MKWMTALALSLLMTPVVANATIVQALNLEQISKEAAVVVHGHVRTQTAAWNPEKTRIYTVTEVQVVEPIKGPHQASSTIRIRQLGGTVDGITQTIVGNAKLKVDEEVVLFLDHDPSKQLHYVVGMAQGKFAVDRRSGTPRVVRSLKGLALADIETHQISDAPARSATAEVPTLDAFKAKVRAGLQPKP
jgi:uncharacterized protein (DUF2249 family)